jgi:hypothetical protein
MSSRDTLALLALNSGYAVSRNISTEADTYKRPLRTLTVEFDAAGEVERVDSSDGMWFAPTTTGVVQALG